MKKFFLSIFILCGLLISGVLWLNYRQNANSTTLISPLPDFLSKKQNSQVSTLDLWLPFLQDILSDTKKEPQLSASSALIYDLSNNRILYEKDPREKLPMASLTKIMTAIVAIDNKRSDDRYVVSKKDLVGENVMGLSAGEVLSLNDLMFGLVLPSGNDSAEVLASNTMERSAFVKAMNDKAKSLGLKDTNFTNPSGLEGDGDQHTTAYDLLVITKNALQHYPLFAKVVATPEYHIEATSEHKAYDLYNETNLLTSYPGVKGVKDGYTYEAGLCLVTYLDYKGHKIIGVLLGSQNRRQEMKDLLDYGLITQDITPPVHD